MNEQAAMSSEAIVRSKFEKSKKDYLEMIKDLEERFENLFKETTDRNTKLYNKLAIYIMENQELGIENLIDIPGLGTLQTCSDIWTFLFKLDYGLRNYEVTFAWRKDEDYSIVGGRFEIHFVDPIEFQSKKKYSTELIHPRVFIQRVEEKTLELREQLKLNEEY